MLSVSVSYCYLLYCWSLISWIGVISHYYSRLVALILHERFWIELHMICMYMRLLLMVVLWRWIVLLYLLCWGLIIALRCLVLLIVLGILLMKWLGLEIHALCRLVNVGIHHRILVINCSLLCLSGRKRFILSLNRLARYLACIILVLI